MHCALRKKRPTIVSSTPASTSSSGDSAAKGLARRLGLFDATMIVMGGIVGAGIFINPYVVAQQVHTPTLILTAWIFGGLIAMAGAFVYAELASRMPAVGGQYAYMREAYHPGVAFLYGWALLLVIQTGGMAAVAITFGKYFLELTHLPISSGVIAASALGILTLINCLGVRAAGTVQSSLMVMKIAIISALVICGAIFLKRPAAESHAIISPILDRPFSFSLIVAFGAAMVPVTFSYGGYQTANFIAGEVREPRKNLPRGLMLGVAGVIALYVSVNYICVRALGAAGLANTTTPASAVMRMALGQRGAAPDRTGYRNFGARISQPIHPHRAARLFCDGRRRSIFSRRRVAQSAHTRPSHRDCAARCLGNRHRAFRPLRTNPKFRQLDGLNFLRTVRSLHFYFQAARRTSAVVARRKRRLSHSRPSIYHRCVYRVLLDRRGRDFLSLSKRFAHRPRHCARRIADIFYLGRQSAKTISQRMKTK